MTRYRIRLVVPGSNVTPSLDLVAPVEQESGLPAVAAAGAYSLLGDLRLAPELPGAGSLLAAATPLPSQL
ncbi:hypothetical protein [Saccharopolyspora elongata]|uniref:Uncharacterized protein n=1 Tax=Saccharopolyspora elongata TaxID=2530387 RepID=A0A4R4XU92_9PSEU|nr:hypothetical protein [Saccharopolyspora elongata]TDD34820.1 hypothetical protein E1288_43975 [Saccharopolyspora elongata]